MNWFKIGKLTTNSGLVFLADPHKILHTNHAANVELGTSYNNFINFLELKEKATGNHGFAQFNDNDGKALGVCVQGDVNKSEYYVWVKTNDEGQIVALQVAFDDTIPS
jgi:hypothetical protein